MLLASALVRPVVSPVVLDILLCCIRCALIKNNLTDSELNKLAVDSLL